MPTHGNTSYKIMPVLSRKKKVSRLLYIVAGILMFGVFLTCVNIYELKQMQMDHFILHTPEVEAQGEKIVGKKTQPIVWIHGKKVGKTQV